MRLFVDDMRKCPEGWVLARTVTEAIRIIDTQKVSEVSLDHDIACRLVMGQEHTSNETFEPVARYIALFREHAIVRCSCSYHEGYDERDSPVEGCPNFIKIRIHTSNFPAGQRMAQILGIEYSNYIYNPKDYENNP